MKKSRKPRSWKTWAFVHDDGVLSIDTDWSRKEVLKIAGRKKRRCLRVRILEVLPKKRSRR